jgi:hypothetical protein
MNPHTTLIFLLSSSNRKVRKCNCCEGLLRIIQLALTIALTIEIELALTIEIELALTIEIELALTIEIELALTIKLAQRIRIDLSCLPQPLIFSLDQT